MPLSGRPLAIDGGELVDAGLIRLLAYAAMGSAEGIIGVNDFVVRAQTSPNASVQISGGAYAALNRFPGASALHQSYMGQGDATPSVAITGNSTGSTKYHYVIIKIAHDVEFADQTAPSDPASGPYDSFEILYNQVNGIVDIADLGLPYPAVLLAKLTVPGSTSTITASMITDLRTVARPRRDRQLRAQALSGSDIDVLDNSSADGETFPNPTFTVDVPLWATYAKIIGSWSGVQVPANSAAAGYLFVRLTGNGVTVNTQTTRFNMPGNQGYHREDFRAVDDVSIPAGLRGVRGASLQLRGIDGSDNGNYLQMDAVGSFDIDIEFSEKASDND